MAPVEGSCHGARLLRGALFVALSGLSVATGDLHAQATLVPTSVIDGYISDADLAPIAEASVSLLGRSAHVVTRDNGRFRIIGLAAGTYVVVANRLGYTPATVRIELAAGDTARPSIALEHTAPMLDTMKAVASHPRSMKQSEFWERRNAGIGHSMNADEIDRRNSPWTKELLRTFVGVGFKNDALAVNMRAGIARDCPFRFYVDGIPKSAPVSIEHDLPSSKDLAGIEVFTSIASVPPQYGTNNGGCGVILLWTKDGALTGEP